MSDPIDRIRHTIPRVFFQSMLEQSDVAFMKAKLLVEQHIDEPERCNALGQFRHPLLEQGFRSAARDAELPVYVCDTEPPGSCYSLVKHKGVCLVRSNVQRHCGPPRAAKFRMEQSRVNTWLDPPQPDLFTKVEKPPTDWLCGMLVTTAHEWGGDQSVPAFVGLGIPYEDLSDWMRLMPLTELLSLYHDHETPPPPPKEPLVEVKDNAKPKLKHHPPGNDG